jgi:hypothetical protein
MSLSNSGNIPFGLAMANDDDMGALHKRRPCVLSRWRKMPVSDLLSNLLVS